MSFTLILKNDFRALNVENISYVRKILAAELLMVYIDQKR